MADPLKPSRTFNSYHIQIFTISFFHHYLNFYLRYHAFNVAQMMFAMLLKTGWDRMFSEVDKFGSSNSI